MFRKIELGIGELRYKSQILTWESSLSTCPRTFQFKKLKTATDIFKVLRYN